VETCATIFNEDVYGSVPQNLRWLIAACLHSDARYGLPDRTDVFIRAIREGVDRKTVIPMFLHWLLTSSESPMFRAVSQPWVSPVASHVAELHVLSVRKSEVFTGHWFHMARAQAVDAMRALDRTQYRERAALHAVVHAATAGTDYVLSHSNLETACSYAADASEDERQAWAAMSARLLKLMAVRPPKPINSNERT
jgi:hypothetical protein